MLASAIRVEQVSHSTSMASVMAVVTARRAVQASAAAARALSTIGDFVDASQAPSVTDVNEWGLHVIPNFINAEEEYKLASYFHKHVVNLPLSAGHFDNAIEHYREYMEPFSSLPSDVSELIHRAGAMLPASAALQRSVHVLDLAPQGAILPHVDSVKFLGGYIIGLSCLSDGVMEFAPAPEEYLSPAPAPPDAPQPTRHTPCPPPSATATTGERVRVWLPRRSLYVMSGQCRLGWTHAVLQGSVTHSTTLTPGAWEGMVRGAGATKAASPYSPASGELGSATHEVTVTRGRRMSILLRDEPPTP